MTATNGEIDRPAASVAYPSWNEFCEREAVQAAELFAVQCRAFVQKHPTTAAYRRPGAWKNFADKFIECFIEHFEVNCVLNQLPNVSVSRSAQVSPAKSTRNKACESVVCPLALSANCLSSSGSALAVAGTSVGCRRPVAHTHSDASPSPRKLNDSSGDSTTDSPTDATNGCLHSDDSGNRNRSKHHRGHGRRAFIRHFSFKVLRDGVKPLRHLFKQHSLDSRLLQATNSGSSQADGNCLSHEHGSKSRSDRGRQLEICKEGVLHQLTGEDSRGKSQWEKCRLVLVKTIGGDMIEFYIPPKSPQPKNGVFCLLINEARETTAMEMPDHENTFVLKADNELEYVLEASDAVSMRAWLSAIQQCLRKTDNPETRNTALEPSPAAGVCLVPDGGTVGRPRSMPPVSDEHGTPHRLRRLSHSTESLDIPPQLPPRSPNRAHTPVGGASNMAHSSPQLNIDMPFNIAEMGDLLLETQMEQTLREYPWFHGTLSRLEAAQLVLQHGVTAHGVFLVRQSETRKGEYVLTFNFQGRAKHLRMSLNAEGQCHVQHLWFQTIFDMLEHFRTRPIPLESGGSSDVTLTDYVISVEPARRDVHGGAVVRSLVDFPHDGRDAVTNGGSVRTRTESMENVTVLTNSGGGGGCARAVENPYSFV